MHQHAKQVYCTTHDGIRPTHVQNSAEDYQKTQRTIKLIGKSSHEPGSATRQAGPGPRRRPTTLSETVTLLKENSFTRTFADSTTCTSDMAAAPATPLDAFLTRLETYVKAGMSGQFLKLTGDLVSDTSPEALPKAVWSGADVPGPAALGGLRCLLDKPEISTAADWANVIPTGGAQGYQNQEAQWFGTHGYVLAQS